MEAPKAMRRGSAAGRAINAVASQAALTLTPSPSPLLTSHANAVSGAAKRIQRIDCRIFDADLPLSDGATSAIVQLQRRLTALAPVAKPLNTLRAVSDGALRTIAEFVAVNDPRAAATFGSVCRRFYSCSLTVLTNITLVPGALSIEGLSAPGVVASLAKFCDARGRGQHIRSLTLVDPRSVYKLPNAVKGPEVHVGDLLHLVTQMALLTFLDVRGVVLRGWQPWTDHFLADIAATCGKLTALRVSPAFLTTWEPGWWQPLQQLAEFAVGSRREDAVWASVPVTQVPLQLPDDFFAMLRTLPALHRLKLWAPVAPASLNAVLFPTTPFPLLQHLSINVHGNTDLKPLEDASKEAEAAKEAAATTGKAPAKPSKAAGKQAEVNDAPKVLFPALTSVALCDIRDRPEFAVELMVRMLQSAPGIQHWNVVNTHRNAPGKAPPPAPTRGARKAAQ